MHDSEDWRDCPGSSLVYAGRGREGRVRGRGERGGVKIMRLEIVWDEGKCRERMGDT